MGGKTGTTTSSVQIPPEVLARYNSVNALAEQVAQTPFQPYTGQFVAGLTPTQQAGVQATSQYSQSAQPYYQAATGQLMQAQEGAMPGISAAYQNVGQAQDIGSQYAQAASGYYGGAANAAMPYYNMMQQGIGGALSYASPLNYAAQNAAYGAYGQAMPYYGAATEGTYGALEAAQPYQQAATEGLGAAMQYSGGINAMTPEMALAAYNESRPIMNQALMGTQGAVQAGQPYQGMATQAAMAGAQGISPEALNIGAYMSPYTQAVADTTYQALRQQQQQEMAGQTANAIRSGAFGGDRSGLVAANLARQQQLGTAQAMAPIYQQGYGQALAAAQQQQGVGLSAAQANRAALQNLAQQLQGIGQQGYAQQLGAAGQIGQLGQNIYGQGIGAAQALSGLGQTGFSQQLQQAQALAALGQQGYGQQLGVAQQLGQLGQNLYGMGANQANLLSQLGQTGYGQQLGAAQQYGNLGQNLYTMGLGTGQALQGLGQQQFGQGLSSAQQLAALAQQGYGMGASTAQQLAALGSGAQQSALQGAQAQLGAGTLEQQTQQADLTAKYQQFLQERGYPFQTAQFLANIAMGTGALSGQTTTTTQPMPFFSDRRVKHDVKEIGETHDGQPIYSFKYNGDNATQIGLMAQDVEKKHPDAVGEYGGVKTVDYKRATEDAERKERYEGGLVPASMGGAVTQPGAYGRGGYYGGGGVTLDPNDLQALLAQQQQAFGPFSETGLYGGTQHQTPFAGVKGIVPQTRMHVPKMLQPAQTPRLPESGVSQALSAYDSAMGLKKRYEEAKEMLGGKDTAQTEMDKNRPNLTTREEVKNLSGPDIKAPETKDENIFDMFKSVFFANGGSVPRQHYAVGGSKDPSIPYDEDDESPYKYFPTEILETEKPDPVKPNQPPGSTSQTGLGIGDVISLGTKIIPFLPFNQGGVVPRQGYQRAGVVEDTEEERMKKVQLSDVGPFKMRENAEMIRGIDPRLVDIARKESVSLPAGQFYEVTSGVRPDDEDSKHKIGKAMDVQIVDESGKRLPNYQDPRQFTAYEKPALVGREYQKLAYPELNKDYAWGGYFSGPPGKYGAMDLMHRSIGEKPAGGSWETGVKPEQMALFEGYVPEDLAATSAKTASLGVKPTPKSKDELSWLARNQEWLVPFGAGLKGMFQSKSPFLGAAIGEGIGAGLEAIGPTQQQLAELAESKARQSQILQGVAASPTVGEITPERKIKLSPTGLLLDTGEGEPKTAAEQLRETQEKIRAETAEAVSGKTSPIKIDATPGNYRTDIAPTSFVDQQFVPYGFTGENRDRDIAIISSKLGFNKKLVAAAEEDQKTADAISKTAANANTIRRDTALLTKSLMNLTPEGESFTGGGAGFDERTRLANVYNWLASYAGINDRIGSQSDIDASQIANKITTLLGTQFTSKEGFSGEQLANSVKQALPSGMMSENARAEMIASMWVANLEPEDFDKYYKNYVGKYGTALNVNKNFRSEMGKQYQDMKEIVKEMIIMRQPKDENGQPIAGTQPDSYFNLLMRDPSLAPQIDAKFGMPGLSRAFIGG